jgi:hypothetical protein
MNTSKNLAAARSLYSAAKSSGQMDALKIARTLRALDLENSRKGEEARAAFAALGWVEPMCTCTHCGGTGISRGTDRGMGCGYCHGYREIPVAMAEGMSAHRAQVSKKHGYSLV